MIRRPLKNHRLESAGPAARGFHRVPDGGRSGGDTDARVMANQIRQTPVAIGEIAPDFPAALAEVIAANVARIFPRLS